MYKSEQKTKERVKEELYLASNTKTFHVVRVKGHGDLAGASILLKNGSKDSGEVVVGVDGRCPSFAAAVRTIQFVNGWKDS